MESPTDRTGVSSSEPSGKSRRWPYSVVRIAAILFLLCLVIGLGVFIYISAARRSSPPYQMALLHVQADRQMIERLGEPIKDTTWLPVVNNDAGKATVNFDVAGPKDKAHVRAEARMVGGQWGLTSVEVDIGIGKPFSLDVGLGEGQSDAPLWSPNEGESTGVEAPESTLPPVKMEGDLPSDVNVQMPNIPELPE